MPGSRVIPEADVSEPARLRGSKMKNPTGPVSDLTRGLVQCARLNVTGPIKTVPDSRRRLNDQSQLFLRGTVRYAVAPTLRQSDTPVPAVRSRALENFTGPRNSFDS